MKSLMQKLSNRQLAEIKKLFKEKMKCETLEGTTRAILLVKLVRTTVTSRIQAVCSRKLLSSLVIEATEVTIAEGSESFFDS